MAGPGADKAVLRARLIAARRARTPEDRRAAADAIAARVLDLADVTAARSIAAYLSIGTEPVTNNIVDTLRSRDVRVLVPVLREDLDLDWAEYGGPGRIAQGSRGMWEPAGPRLGVDALTGVDLVIVPALAVDERGLRLGRGGGSYDRALARVPDLPAFALLYDGECPVAVPAQPHDRPVTAAALPRGVLRFAPSAGSPGFAQ